MLVFDGKAIAIFRYFVIIILYCKSIHSDFFQQDTFFIVYTVDSRYLEFDGTMEKIRINRSSTQEEL